VSHFIKLMTIPSPSPVLLNVDHIVEVWRYNSANEEGSVVVTTASDGEETVIRTAESFDEIVALLTMTGHSVETRTATDLSKEAKRDARAHAERLRHEAGWPR